MTRLLAAIFSALLAGCLPCVADQLLPNPQIDQSGNVKFRGGPVLGRMIGGVYTPGAPTRPENDNGTWAASTEYADRAAPKAARNRSFQGTMALDGRAFADPGQTTGYFSDWDSKSDNKVVTTNTEVITPSAAGGMRDGTLLQFRDRDTTDYSSSSYRVISNGLRVTTSGRNDGTGYVGQYKDLHGGWFSAVGNTAGVARGVSGLVADAIQFGTGVATNEFTASTVAGFGRPALLGPVMGILYNNNGDVDGTHNAHGVQAILNGYKATSAFRAASVAAGGQPGAAKFGLRLDEMIVTDAAITMPQGPAGNPNVGTLIDYGAGAYTLFDRNNNAYVWSINGAEVYRIDSGSWIAWNTGAYAASGSLGSASSTGRYRKDGKTIHFTVKVSIPSNGTGAGAVGVTLPIAAYAAGNTNYMVTGRNDTTGAMLQGKITGSALSIFRYDNGYPAADGSVLILSGDYEAP